MPAISVGHCASQSVRSILEQRVRTFTWTLHQQLQPPPTPRRERLSGERRGASLRPFGSRRRAAEAAPFPITSETVSVGGVSDPVGLGLVASLARPGGGIAISGQGRYWEIRDTLSTVKDAAGPAATAASSKAEAEHVNVRGAIFGV